jgi:hypothetical protein
MPRNILQGFETPAKWDQNCRKKACFFVVIVFIRLLKNQITKKKLMKEIDKYNEHEMGNVEKMLNEY